MTSDFWDRIAHVDNVLGREHATPAEKAFTNAMADQIIANDRLRVGPLDDDSDAQELAQETVGNYHWHIGMDFPNEGDTYGAYGLLGRKPKPTEFAEHGGCQYDPTDPTTFNRLYGILAGMPEQLIPLSPTYTWKDVVNHRLSNYRICNVRISRRCEKEQGTERLAIKSGEFVCIYASCTACRTWFDLDNFDRRVDQARAIIGKDFRNGTFRR